MDERPFNVLYRSRIGVEKADVTAREMNGDINMDERLFDVIYTIHDDDEYANVVAREMKGDIKSRYLENDGALNYLANFFDLEFGFFGYEMVVKANSPREAIDIFWKLLKEFEGGGS